MSNPNAVRSARLECRASTTWMIDECRVIAVLEAPARVYAWVRTGALAELRAYEEASGRLREVSRQVAAMGAAAVAQDGRATCYVRDAKTTIGKAITITPLLDAIGDARRPEVALALRNNFCDVSWLGADSPVAAAIGGSWPVGVLWRQPKPGSWTNLEPHPGLDFSSHQPIIATCSNPTFVAIARRYGGVEVYSPTDNERTCTPTAIEYESAAPRGWLWASALSLSDDGARVMMSGSDADRGFVLIGSVETATARKQRSPHERPFWLDPVKGPLSDDPLCPQESLLRVFPVQPDHVRAPCYELPIDRAFAASDVNAQARTYVLAASDKVIAGSLSEDGSMSSAELEGRAQSVRVSNSGGLVAVGSHDGLRVFDLHRQ
jgi:hypothetical protein